MAMVVKANKHNPPDGGDLGGHIASFASLATMIGCGQNHFCTPKTKTTAATWSTSRATPRPACTAAPTSKAA